MARSDAGLCSNDITTFDVKPVTCHGQMDKVFTADHIAAFGDPA
jgi:hypothetical protein